MHLWTAPMTFECPDCQRVVRIDTPCWYIGKTYYCEACGEREKAERREAAAEDHADGIREERALRRLNGEAE